MVFCAGRGKASILRSCLRAVGKIQHELPGELLLLLPRLWFFSIQNLIFHSFTCSATLFSCPQINKTVLRIRITLMLIRIPLFTLMWIRIRLLTLMRNRIWILFLVKLMGICSAITCFALSAFLVILPPHHNIILILSLPLSHFHPDPVSFSLLIRNPIPLSSHLLSMPHPILISNLILSLFHSSSLVLFHLQCLVFLYFYLFPV